MVPARLSREECQCIVNEFGRAMAKIGRAAASGAEASRQVIDGAFRFDRSYLPHSPELIREAVRVLLLYEKDPTNIETLHLGLKYLTYFD